MKIQLPDVVIANLYKDMIVLADNVPATTQQSMEIAVEKIRHNEQGHPPAKKWFLGDNKKNILILLRDSAAVYISDEWLETLSKLLTACKLNMGDVAIINYHHQSPAFTVLKEELLPQYVLMFDVSTQDIQLPFAIPHYQIQQYGGCIFMTAPAITLTVNNTEAIKAEKRRLWEKLKLIFAV